MTREEKKQQRRNEIIEVAETYRDSKGNIDLSKLRNEKPKVYSKIPYYFNNIDEFLVNMNSDRSEDNNAAGTSLNRAVVRNELAFDMLKYLRYEKKMSLDEIGKKYDVSKMYISRLFRDLEKVFGDDVIEEQRLHILAAKLEEDTVELN